MEGVETTHLWVVLRKREAQHRDECPLHCFLFVSISPCVCSAWTNPLRFHFHQTACPLISRVCSLSSSHVSRALFLVRLYLWLMMPRALRRNLREALVRRFELNPWLISERSAALRESRAVAQTPLQMTPCDWGKKAGAEGKTETDYARAFFEMLLYFVVVSPAFRAVQWTEEWLTCSNLSAALLTVV